jgi:hypothetical protein
MRENSTHYATAKKSSSGFTGIFAKKPVGIGIAKLFFRIGVDGAFDLSSSTNRHPKNEKNKKTLLNV